MSSAQSGVSEDGWRQVRQVGSADLAVGIPSFNNVSTIGYVVQAAAAGIARHFPSLKAVIIDSDGGSSDGTRQVVEATPVPAGVDKVVLTYKGLPGKGSAFRAIFEVASALGVKACVVVDADLRSITPDWMRLLADPVMRGDFGYVTPFYVRHKYDGTITNSIAYPLTRALYGVSVRQPIGGEFGISAQLLERFLAKDVWDTDVARFGIDVWMTTTAICEGFSVCQARLGAKVHDPKDPAASLGPMFRQVVGTLLGLMRQYERIWQGVTTTSLAPLIGEEISVEPEAIAVNVPAMVERWRTGYRSEVGFWSCFLAKENLTELERIASLAEEKHSFPLDLWVRVVYDFAVAYNRADLEPSRVVDSLAPLYYGRTAAFCLETADLATAEVEAGPIEMVARRFEELKPYLARRWQAAVGR